MHRSPSRGRQVMEAHHSFTKNTQCLVIEQESWIDAINNHEFGVNQIYEPGRPYSWESMYIFSVQKFS
ncbi:hypothetical protein F5146DRAFT_956908 [Armillaria mellea]|nr:hypothetical protein F5146DRAFT_956908 [Armillaria mellea]